MEDGPRKRRKLAVLEPESFVFRDVLQDIPLQSEDTQEEVHITCVEYWNGNLYIGTSASELLHLVALPPESDHDAPTYILASRLQPGGYSASVPIGLASGVQQVVVLPGVSKACVLCNGVVSFYTLPELSPASPSREPTGVQWIGGIDENEDTTLSDGPEIMIATQRKIMLIRIGERLKHIRSVDYPACLRSSRRETIACVANEATYSLLEVEHQQQIPLTPICSTNLEQETTPQQTTQSGHSRSTSLGNPLSPPLLDADTKHSGRSLEVPRPEGSREGSSTEEARSVTRPRSSTDTSPARSTRASIHKLKPHILSPSPMEFMLTTGTTKSEPGVGTFFNLDGDPSRGTIEFDRYPDALIVHSFDDPTSLSREAEQQHVIALLDKTDVNNGTKGLEIQALDADSHLKEWMPLPIQTTAPGGLHQCFSQHQHFFVEIVELLRAVRYKPNLPQIDLGSDPRTQASIKRLEQETALFEDQASQAASPTVEYEQKRTEEEQRFVSPLGRANARAVVWSGSCLWQILPSPLLFELENRFVSAGFMTDGKYDFTNVNVPTVISLLGSIREREPRNEAEAQSLNYIRLKASLGIFLHLQTTLERSDLESACRLVQNALLESSIDPRVVLLLLPPLAREVIQGQDGLWLNQGIVDALSTWTSQIHNFEHAPYPFWFMIRRFLSEWQERRGYASIANDKHLFDSIAAALLHVLLYLDQALPERERAEVRSKLHHVVDNWKGDFSRAIILLEHYRRLFVLSRLYQSRKLAKDVLATWKRIVEGEGDEDKSLTTQTVELQVRRYLTKISNVNVVQEYGLWLAQRNADLAIQVFTDDTSRVKLTPAQVVPMLKTHAPGAVQQYLEHLVFGKNLDIYTDDLIGYYLDSVLSVLENSPAARESLEQSYIAYRALEFPKPTYLNFITQNTPPQQWWKSRLRLLQLLGSGGYAARKPSDNDLTYSVDKVLERLMPFSSYLVSESIILDARQGRHKEALRLLTHGLGDYDTAIRYCYFGGPAPSHTVDVSSLPSTDIQKDLFHYLYHEFMQIKNSEESLERTCRLLGTFATWFDPLTILNEIPNHWTVDALSQFLLRTLRETTSKRNETVIVKALSAAQNLQKQASFIALCEKLGPRIETGGIVEEREIV